MLSTMLDIAGLALLVLCALVAFGPAAAIGVAAACCLVASWAMSRPSTPRRRRQ
jgi:hypothetical protein